LTHTSVYIHIELYSSAASDYTSHILQENVGEVNKLTNSPEK